MKTSFGFAFSFFFLADPSPHCGFSFFFLPLFLANFLRAFLESFFSPSAPAGASAAGVASDAAACPAERAYELIATDCVVIDMIDMILL